MQTGEASVPEFSPDFAERFFGEDGKIIGYKNVKIIVWLHALSFHSHVEISHMDVAQDRKVRKQQVTDLSKIFKDIFGDGLIEDRAVFLELLASYKDFSDLLHQHGRKIASWNLSEERSWDKVENDTSDATKEILCLEDLTSKELKDWHARLTPLALMFIEAATPIELKDPRWEVYVCLEKASNESSCVWKMVGFCRVYRFFKYPDSTRLRVSQILVLPPYRGKQNGFHLLETVYQTAVERGSFEVTMEEPSSDLQVLRECMDTALLLSFDPVRSELQMALSKFKLNSELKGSIVNFKPWMPSPALVENVRQTLKICKTQFHYCWQVLIYLHIMGDAEEKVLSFFQSLVARMLRLEVFGNSKSVAVGKNKMLLDVENEHDSSRTFMMFKVKPSPGNGSNGVVKVDAYFKEAVDTDPETNAEDAFQELLKEREEEINQGHIAPLLGYGHGVSSPCSSLY
ncbi:hypothetical protein GOP47_0022433 [Adiantum capillus-veneris]|uniref:histone acetyltransferase n=1 Tax=Adiantum capillus-veneris TaxID=13818 RepID=A0A9D4U5B9_ADICA|nr:hypothetical protein GOP47_0022433 [Adiantum capillus-veneris]